MHASFYAISVRILSMENSMYLIPKYGPYVKYIEVSISEQQSVVKDIK